MLFVYSYITFEVILFSTWTCLRLAECLTSEGNAKVHDCWKGQDPELRTWMLKSTEGKERQTPDKNQGDVRKQDFRSSALYKQEVYNRLEKQHDSHQEMYLQSKGSELERCCLNCSFKSLLTPMSWNMRWSLEVYSKPHACCRNKTQNECKQISRKLLFWSLL